MFLFCHCFPRFCRMCASGKKKTKTKQPCHSDWTIRLHIFLNLITPCFLPWCFLADKEQEHQRVSVELNPKTMNGVEQHESLQSSVQLQCNLGRPKSKSSSVKSYNATTQLETKTDDSVKRRGKLDPWLLCAEVIRQLRPLLHICASPPPPPKMCWKVRAESCSA